MNRIIRIGIAVLAALCVIVPTAQANDGTQGGWDGHRLLCTLQTEDGTLVKHPGPWHAARLVEQGWTCEDPTVALPCGTVSAAGAGGPCVQSSVPQGPDRFVFCAVVGNTTIDGTPIVPGSALNLEPDQATSDPHYEGATIGFFVAGLGATCELTPAQAAIAASSTTRVNHVGGTGDPNQPEVYMLVG